MIDDYIGTQFIDVRMLYIVVQDLNRYVLNAYLSTCTCIAFIAEN